MIPEQQAYISERDLSVRLPQNAGLYFEIVNFSNGKLISAAPINFGAPMDYGKTVRLRQGNVELIVVSDRFQTSNAIRPTSFVSRTG